LGQSLEAQFPFGVFLMKLRTLRTSLIVGFAAMLLATVCPPKFTTSHAQVRAPTEIKVGITEYQDVEGSYERYEKLFQEFTAAANRDEPVSFKFAIGNYGEVMDWYNKGEIDVAILSAMPVANFLRDAGESDKAQMREAYIGDVSVTRVYSDSTPLVTGTEEQLANKDPFFYRSVCLTLASDNELRTIDDIKRLQDKIKFIFVRPFSLSGYIVPRYVLREHGINPTKDQMEFSYEHQNSVKKLLKEARRKDRDPNQHFVAFVLDEMRYKREDSDPEKVFQEIKINELEREAFRIPRERVFVNYHLRKDTLPDGEGARNKFEKFKTLMQKLFPKDLRTVVVDPSVTGSLPVRISLRPRTEDWEKSYETNTRAIAGIALPRQLPYKSTVDKLLADFAGYVDRPKSEQVKTPRLALVLSGGGAKCSYQAGAIIEIEAKLAELNENRAKNDKEPVDIDLVVGTSGGAINALLVAAGVTKSDDALLLRNQRAEELASLWASFKQQEFFRPSGRFNLIFGLCFGLLQAIIITIAVIIFGRHTMNWWFTAAVIVSIGVLQVVISSYFDVPWTTIGNALKTQAKLLLVVILIVFIAGWLIDLGKWMRKKWRARYAAGALEGDSESLRAASELHHWRWMTILLMLALSAIEFGIARFRGLDKYVSLFGASHWTDHSWMLLTLVSNWSFPYPLLIAIVMLSVGVFVWRDFDWNRRREKIVWGMAIVLIVMMAVLALETLFRASAPSKAEGIEQAFGQKLPRLIRSTSDMAFQPTPPIGDESPLQSISRQLMERGTLKRDLIITTSRLPIDINSFRLVSPPPLDPQRQVELVNGLPEDLYFYFRANRKDELKPPVDRRFVPFTHNPKTLLDVVIGSSTIYPIFPSRVLEHVTVGNEDGSSRTDIRMMKIIDGGFIHNIPIEAASLWKASHIILIEASPLPQQSAPQHFLDNSIMAFGYLFSQAQRTDKLARGSAETFELRPTSRCEKRDVEPSCIGVDNIPQPDMDTFDFSDTIVREAFQFGRNDVSSDKPLFVRVAGPPLFRELTSAARRERKVGGAIYGKS
jgi:predicted acylesterase/phospholipase RssA/ABC-type phosphate/phosphonate transport system substrate-binding protein